MGGYIGFRSPFEFSRQMGSGRSRFGHHSGGWAWEKAAACFRPACDTDEFCRTSWGGRSHVSRANKSAVDICLVHLAVSASLLNKRSFFWFWGVKVYEAEVCIVTVGGGGGMSSPETGVVFLRLGVRIFLSTSRFLGSSETRGTAVVKI